MIEIIFGIFWLTISSVFIFMFYSGAAGGTITVNGEIVSQAEFNEMFAPKLFFAAFIAVGVIFIFVGLRRIIKNAKTEMFGEMCYGRITDVFESGTYINDIPELKAHITVYIESTGTLEEVSSVIGLANNKKYNVGDYVEGKFYNGDINLTSYVPETLIPLHIQDKFQNININLKEQDSIIIDGIEYVRKNQTRTNYL